MDPFSLDLRKKIVEAKERGMPTAEVAKTFGVGVSTVKRYAATAREGRSLAPKKRPGSKPKLDEGARRLLEADLEERPAADLTPEARVPAADLRGFGERVDRFADAQADGMEQKKRSVGASERDEFLRAAWRVMVAASTNPERLVFVDEMGTNTSLTPQYAWSRRGERAHARVPRNWGANVTLLASLSVGGMGPCLAVEGPKRPRRCSKLI